MFTPDGFYRTGDLGRVDEDGYLWYGGRLDDMVKVKGATVYPSEVEAALRSVDGVRQAYVTDVDGADERPEVGAVVVTDASVDDGRRRGAGTAERVQGADPLAAHRRPRRRARCRPPARSTRPACSASSGSRGDRPT